MPHVAIGAAGDDAQRVREHDAHRPEISQAADRPELQALGRDKQHDHRRRERQRRAPVQEHVLGDGRRKDQRIDRSHHQVDPRRHLLGPRLLETRLVTEREQALQDRRERGHRHEGDVDDERDFEIPHA